MSETFNFKDRVPVRGTLQLIYMKGEYPIIMGSDILIDPAKTQILFREKGQNLVVDEGRKILNETMSGTLPPGITSDPIKYFCTGTGGYIGTPDPDSDPEPPTGADLDLYQPLFQKELFQRFGTASACRAKSVAAAAGSQFYAPVYFTTFYGKRY